MLPSIFKNHYHINCGQKWASGRWEKGTSMENESMVDNPSVSQVERLQGHPEAAGRGAPVDAGEEPLGVFGAKDAVDASPTATMVVDRNCRVLLVNPEAVKVLELEEQGPFDLWDEMSASGKAIARRVVVLGETLRDHRLRFQKSPGKARCLCVNAAPVRGPEGIIRGAVATFVDISAQVWVEDALQLHMDRLAILRDIDRAILAVRPPREIAELAFMGILRLVPCDDAVLCCIEAASGRLVPLIVDGKRGSRDGSPFGLSGRDCSSFMGILAEGEVLLFADTDAAAANGQRLPENLRDYGRSVLLAPFVSSGSLTGCLVLAAQRANAFGDEHAAIVKDVSMGLAVSLQNALLITTLEQKGKDIAALARRLEATQEEERKRLSRELHDSIGQNLTAIGIRLSIAQDSLAPASENSGLQEEFSKIFAIIGATAEKIRDVMCDLRPPVLDDFGLFVALSWLCRKTAQKSSTSIKVTGAEVSPRLTPDAELTFFRITQEAINNAIKHSRARGIVLDLSGDKDCVTLSVSDDGVGFDPDCPTVGGGERHWGMAIMRERALSVGGNLKVSSFPGKGVRVTVELAGKRRD